MSVLVDKIVALHRSFEAARIPHAFGGALALAWCTQRARGTIDIDVNVFVPSDASKVASATSTDTTVMPWNVPAAAAGPVTVTDAGSVCVDPSL